MADPPQEVFQGYSQTREGKIPRPQVRSIPFSSNEVLKESLWL